MHKVSEGKVCLWKDYWEFNAIANATWFQSSLEGGGFELGVRRERPDLIGPRYQPSVSTRCNAST